LGRTPEGDLALFSKPEPEEQIKKDEPQEESQKDKGSQWVDLEVGDDYREVPAKNGTSKSEHGKEEGQDKRRDSKMDSRSVAHRTFKM
jgi:hypothetical protein